MKASEFMVTVHVDVELDGQPITQILEAPASMENLEVGKGLHIHVALDSRKLADLLLPHLAQRIRNEIRNETGPRTL